MFWRKPAPPPPALAGLWLSEQVLLWFDPAPFPGAPPDWSHRWTPGLGLHGFSSPVAAEQLRRMAGGRIARVRDEPAIAWLQARGGEGLPRELAHSLAWALAAPERIQLAEALLFVRDRLRARRPAPIAGGLPSLCLDQLIRAGPATFYLRGWWRNRSARVVRLTITSPEGLQAELAGNLAQVARPDIPLVFPGDSYAGFLSTFDLPWPAVLAHGWVVEMELADGFVCEAPAPPVLDDPTAAVAALLSDFDLESPPSPLGAAGHIDRAVSLVLARRRERCAPKADWQFGRRPENPVLSVIVPLFGRTDLMEHQLVAFADDPDWRDCELIYVLDSPELAPALRPRAEALHALYGVAFRVLVPGHTGGYAVANNLAARTARGDLLLLLNSDVLPAGPGWIPRLIAARRRRPHAGAIGPKLLYEDGSIQHAGMDYEAVSDGFGWGPDPLFKGMHRNLPAANRPRRVMAVTGACLLVARADYFRVGGLDEGYVQGDYEDLDLCLRLAAAGLQNWYEPGVELYHFEGTSYPSAQRITNALYNRWRHSQRWGDGIAARQPARHAVARQEDAAAARRSLHSGDDVARSASHVL